MRIPHYIGTIIGAKAAGDKLELPDDAVTQGFAILAKRGKGKTNLAADMEEEFLRQGQPIVVLDPPAAHWGIRYEADEQGRPSGPSGFEVLIIGGDHGDIPLEQTDGREAARIIVDGNMSTIVDMRSLSFNARQKWCAEFADEIFRINKTPRHIFFEEAQNFLPQVLKFDEQKAVLYAMSRIIEEGRSSGLGFTIISQRPAKINKDALTQIDNLIVLGMMGPQDLDQVEEWFKHHFADKQALQDMVATLPHLKPGFGWALMPELLKEPIAFQARLRVTYHAGRTPKPGEKPVNVSKISVGEAVERLKKLFASKQTERRQEIQDLATANRRIRELEKQIKTHASYKSTSSEVRKQEDPRIARRAIERAVAGATKQYDQVIRSQMAAFREIAVYAVKLEAIAGPQAARAALPKPALSHFSGGEIHQKEAVSRSVPTHAIAGVRTAASDHPRPTSSGEIPHLKAGARKMLTILAQWHPDPKTRDELGALAGFAATGGTFSDYLSKLRLAGFISENGDGIHITDEGLGCVGAIPPRPSSTEQLAGMWRSKFKAGVGKMLDTLIDAYPAFISRELLGERSGFAASGGTFSDYLSQLRRARLIQENGQNVKAADSLFP